MNTFLKELFDYNFYGNKLLIESMMAHAGCLSERTWAVMSHILNSHHIWNCRIETAAPLYNPWDMHRVEDMEKENRAYYFDSLLIIDRFDLEKCISYTTKKGEALSNSVKDILFQVINHSTYHRGQLALEFRKAGIEPLLTDYIFYKTQKEQFGFKENAVVK